MRFSPLPDPRLRLFDMLDHAVWITEPVEVRIVWANRAALELWRADSLDELVNRPINPSPTIRANLAQICDRAKGGERTRQQRTMFPKGQPVRVEMVMGAFYPEDGGPVHLLIEARRIEDADPEMVRASEAVRYAPLVVTTHALDGSTLQANVLARQVFGGELSFQNIFADTLEAERALGRLERGETIAGDFEVTTLAGPKWYAIEARRIIDPVTGKPAILMSGHDMTVRIEAEQAKEDLVSVVSHELRTPITAIRGAIELLGAGVAEGQPELMSELLHIASENTRRLSSVVEDLLDVRKLAAGGLSLQIGPEEMGALVKSAVDLYGIASDARGVEVELEANGALPVLADKSRMQQVVLNLLSNAVKHTPAGGRVDIRAERRGDVVRVEVKDQGPGVPESFRDRIFKRFSQADASSTRASSGTGLGLYIAKTLVEQHGGKVGYENAVDGGAIFFFELPARPTVLPNAAEMQASAEA